MIPRPFVASINICITSRSVLVFSIYLAPSEIWVLTTSLKIGEAVFYPRLSADVQKNWTAWFVICGIKDTKSSCLSYFVLRENEQIKTPHVHHYRLLIFYKIGFERNLQKDSLVLNCFRTEKRQSLRNRLLSLLKGLVRVWSISRIIGEMVNLLKRISFRSYPLAMHHTGWSK